MPYVNIQIVTGATRGQKTELAEDVTASLVRMRGKKPGQTHSIMQEIASKMRVRSCNHTFRGVWRSGFFLVISSPSKLFNIEHSPHLILNDESISHFAVHWVAAD
jgi:4-oxalocrotonate tautomerase